MNPKDDRRYSEVRHLRGIAAAKYRPAVVRCLLVAEAPPSADNRYFYFEGVSTQDSLFRYVCKVVLGEVGLRRQKATELSELRARGVFLIDLSEDPVEPGTSAKQLRRHVPALVRRCLAIDADNIILIKATVHDAAYVALCDAGLPVSAARIPFPGSGQQSGFVATFGPACAAAGLV